MQSRDMQSRDRQRVETGRVETGRVETVRVETGRVEIGRDTIDRKLAGAYLLFSSNIANTTSTRWSVSCTLATVLATCFNVGLSIAAPAT